MIKIGKQLKRLRIERKLTHEKLAAMVGTSIGTISRLENDQNEPEAETWFRLARTFGVPMENMCEPLEREQASELDILVMAAARRAQEGDVVALVEMRRLSAELARVDAARADGARSKGHPEKRRRKGT